MTKPDSHPNAERLRPGAALERLEPCEAKVSRTVLKWYGWVIRAVVLTNGPPRQRPMEIGQQDRSMTFRTRFPRADVAALKG